MCLQVFEHQSPPEMEQLPPEILFCCFSYLKDRDLARCLSVSHRWRDIARDNNLWKELVLHELSISPIIYFNSQHGIMLDAPKKEWAKAYAQLYSCLRKIRRIKRREQHSNSNNNSIVWDSFEAEREKRVCELLGINFDSCIFCEKRFKEEQTYIGSTSSESLLEKRLRLFCLKCDYCILLRSCPACKSFSSVFTFCGLCTLEVCQRCYIRQCEYCKASGCTECIRPLTDFSSRSSPCRYNKAAGKKAFKMLYIQSQGSSHSHSRPEEDNEGQQEFICGHCGVFCIMCGAAVEEDDTNYCEACETTVCLRCDCLCGALNMYDRSFQQHHNKGPRRK